MSSTAEFITGHPDGLRHQRRLRKGQPRTVADWLEEHARECDNPTSDKFDTHRARRLRGLASRWEQCQ